MLLLYLYTFLFVISPQPVSIWTPDELIKANTAAEVDYLDEEEKMTVMLVNLARLDGKRYLQSYFQGHNNTPYENMEHSDNSYMRSLKKDLDKIKGLPMLLPDDGLNKSARYHAKDSGKKGLVGHTSSDGVTFGNRLAKYVKGWNRLAENCSYGYPDAVNIVGQLLLDDNVPGLGHRKSILNPDLEYIGVSIQPHSVYRYNCVMDFCAKFED